MDEKLNRKGTRCLPSIEKILWLDASHVAGWHTPEDIEALTLDLCTSYGRVLRETETFIVIGATISDDEALGATVIPKAWIKERSFIND